MAIHRGALSIPKFCLTYDVGRSKTYEEINSGRLKAKKVGRKTLIINADEWFANLPDLHLPAMVKAGGADAGAS